MITEKKAKEVLETLISQLEDGYSQEKESRVLLGLSDCYTKFGMKFCQPLEDKYRKVMEKYRR